MSEYKIVTIGRQFGSGGREIGQKLAKRLEIPLYDHRLVSMAAKELGIKQSVAAKVDEESLNAFLSGYQVNTTTYSQFINAASYIYSLNEDVYEKQKQIILTLAAKGPCVIIGRCADYILKDSYECVNVFICASRKDRIARIMERYDLTARKAAAKIRKTDRDRKYYYEDHTGYDWGSIDSHQALLNVSLLGQEKIVDILEKMYRG